MNEPLFYLINLLEDEFRDFKEVRIKPVFPSGVRRSVDLEQDYNPESSAIHRLSGVNVHTKRRQYFFPEEWMAPALRGELEKQIQDVRDELHRCSAPF